MKTSITFCDVKGCRVQAQGEPTHSIAVDGHTFDVCGSCWTARGFAELTAQLRAPRAPQVGFDDAKEGA